MGITTRLTLLAFLVAISLQGPRLSGRSARGDTNFPLLSNDECWQRLPKADRGNGQPLPSWARALADPLPRTTAALLRFDFVHRTRSPLDPKLRAKMRLVAAMANRCAYAEAHARFDARRAGIRSEELLALSRGYSQTSAAEQAALEFARKMTTDSAGVTDEEFATLVKDLGDRNAVAMVLLVAYSNFQDRLLLCLGSPLEPDGPAPPVAVDFVPDALESRTLKPLPSKVSALPAPTGKATIQPDLDWTAVSYDELQARVERQKQRPTRLRVPDWEEVARGLPPGFMRPSKITSVRVCMGYQPELSSAWETVRRTYSAEIMGKMDEVFLGSVFWIVTRAMDCPYCMGHCEMNWEVAGLPKSLIAQRSRLLAGRDWSSFPPEEQRAFAVARKLTRAPGTISGQDIEALKHDFGPQRALYLLIHVCRYNYMTRVTNGLQPTLEAGNPFFEYYSAEPPRNGPHR
jgi:AhpD family alkylhydroperoxidase